MHAPLATIVESAHAAWDAGDLVRAREFLEHGAEAGDAGCILNLAYFYDEGRGVKKNKDQAMRLYKRACRMGHAAAASNIAILYREKGKYKLSFLWFRRSARLKDGDAELELAKLLAVGRGVRRSAALALKAARRARTSKHITPAGREEASATIATLRSARLTPRSSADPLRQPPSGRSRPR
jgi:uncharacterized protein